MKLDIDFTNLENLVKNMGASSVDWVSDVAVTHVETDWKIILETKGIDVDINDVEIKSNGLLHYRGEQILLYIKEVSSGLPKFHFIDCSTLKKMNKMKRFYRYVVTQRKDGYFLMDIKNSYSGGLKSDQLEHLDVCRNCLDWYNYRYKNYCSVKDFDIEELFRHLTQSPISQKPIYTDQDNGKFTALKKVENDKQVAIQLEIKSIEMLNSADSIKLERERQIYKMPYPSQEKINTPELSESTISKNDVNNSTESIAVVPLLKDEATQDFEDMF